MICLRVHDWHGNVVLSQEFDTMDEAYKPATAANNLSGKNLPMEAFAEYEKARRAYLTDHTGMYVYLWHRDLNDSKTVWCTTLSVGSYNVEGEDVRNYK